MAQRLEAADRAAELAALAGVAAGVVEQAPRGADGLGGGEQRPDRRQPRDRMRRAARTVPAPTASVGEVDRVHRRGRVERGLLGQR